MASPVDTTRGKVSVAILDVIAQLKKHSGHLRPGGKPYRVHCIRGQLSVSEQEQEQEQCMLDCLTVRIGQRPRVEGLILAYGADERRAVGAIILERHWDQGEHEILQVVKEGCSGSLAQISRCAIRITKHAAIGRIRIIWAQVVRVGALSSR